VYLEQPEIHLRPRAQVALAETIARAVNRGVQVIVETHRELLLLGIQRLVAVGELASDKVKLHRFAWDDEGVTRVTPAVLDEEGSFGDWPVDFVDMSMRAMRVYLDAVTLRRRGRL
jgi:predicted ATPase